MRIIKGDLIELTKQGEFDVIAHGCNCFSTMGAGIAAQIKKEFPWAYKADMNSPLSPIEKLGNFTETYEYVLPNPLLDREAIQIYNLYTQFGLGKNLNYDALSLCLYKLSKLVSMGARIGLPQIGCGIAGGQWSKVKLLIIKHLGQHNVTIVEYKPKKKK